MDHQLFSAALRSAALGLTIVAFSMSAHAATNLNSSKSNLYRPISTDAERATCTQSGGKVVMRDGKPFCETQSSEGGGTPDPQEGITITGCAPSASGDPLKGLNVSKGGTSSGGQLCP